jgi:hypothetical protein
MTVELERAAPSSTNTFNAASHTEPDGEAQLVKIMHGAEGAGLVASTANPFPVAVQGVATAAAQTTGNNALASIDAKLTGAATEATLAQVRDSIRAQIDIASTIWTDNSGAFYVRRDSVDQGTGTVTVVWTAPDGTTATPGAGLRPLSTLDRDVTQALFDATSGGTGYSPGDLLARVLIIDANVSPASLTAIWVNLTTGAVIAAPTGGTIERADEAIGARQVGTWNVNVAASVLATGAATEATLTAIQTLINTLSGTVQNHNATFVDGSPGQIVLAKRRDSDTTLVADGDLNCLNMDEEGRLKVASKPASYAATTGNVVNAASTVAINTERFSNLMAHCAGVFAGVNCTFEGSLNSTNGVDGNWFGVQAVRSNANTVETATGVLGAAPAYAWELSVNALRWFRIRSTAWTSGAQVWTLIPGTYATEPVPAAQVSATQPVSFTQPALVAGTAAIGDVGIQHRANATGAASVSPVIAAASTNATVVKASAGRLIGWQLQNTTASLVYVKLHNQTTTPTAGASVAFAIPIPANGKSEITVTGGLAFTTGIGFTTVTGSANTDATAVTAGAIIGTLHFA